MTIAASQLVTPSLHSTASIRLIPLAPTRGHRLLSLLLDGVIAVLVARTSLPAWLRVVAIAGLGTLIGIVGLSRVYLGAHYPSDVVGGYLVGLAGVVVFATLSTLIDPRVPASMGPRAARGQRGDGAS